MEYPCGCAPLTPCEVHTANGTCPACGLPVDHKSPLYRTGGDICSPFRCSAWRVVGKSKNGGPLLRLVADA